MNPLSLNSILILPLDEVPFSERFCSHLWDNKIYTLEELLEYKVHEMLALPNFQMHDLMELTEVLQKYGGTYLLDHE